MQRGGFARYGLCAALALAPLAVAQAPDLLAAAKVACVPDKVTTCTSDDKCESREASEKDKADVLILDFTAKKATIRNAGNLQPVGEIVRDEIAGEERRFAVREEGAADFKVTAMTLSRMGKLTLRVDARRRAEATCTPES